MTQAEATRLDVDEYLHLALYASGKGDHEKALGCLKSAHALESDNALVIYLLAAEHAEIGLYPRARAGFRQALAIRPDLDVARFQLGLLHVQLDEAADARDAFAHIARHGTDAALRTYAEGLLALLDGDAVRSEERLRSGLAICRNEPLNADMQCVLARLGENGAVAADATSAARETTTADAPDATAVTAAPSAMPSATPSSMNTAAIATEATAAEGSANGRRAKPIFLGAYRNTDNTAQ